MPYTRRVQERTTHGEYDPPTPEYRSWVSMIQRCYNSHNASYHRYGARGIKVCERWLKSYQNFLSDMGRKPSPAHTIERKDGTGGYEPSNCTWATVSEQARNRSTNRHLTINGITRSVAEWVEVSGIKRDTLIGRIERGWPESRLLSPSRAYAQQLNI